MKMARLRKYLGLILFCLVLNAQAFDVTSVQTFDAVKLDEAVTTFLNKLFAEKCKNIEYSFIYAINVGIAFEEGFYSTNPSDLNPPELITDTLVAIKTNICGWQDGYLITFREEEDSYKVIGYTSFDQPQ